MIIPTSTSMIYYTGYGVRMNNNTPLDIEFINERDREEESLTVDRLYDAQGELISDKQWDKLLEEE